MLTPLTTRPSPGAFAGILALLLLLAACGSPEPDREGEVERSADPAGAEGPASAAQQAQRAMQGLSEAFAGATGQNGDGRVVETVDFRRLRDLLPESASGIERTDASGERQAMGGFSVSQASGTYRDEQRSLEIKIVDAGAAGSFMALGAVWMMAEVDRESSTGFERTTRFQGYPAFEKYDESGRRTGGKIEMVVGDRFFVTVEGRHVSMEEIRAAAGELDLRRLAAMRDEGREG